MRPSMMTLVSRILSDFLDDFFAAEDAAEGRQVQHVALLGAHDEADVGHQEQEAHLQKGLGGGFTQYERHEKSAHNSEDAAARGADQALEADALQAHFEQNDAQAEHHSAGRRHPR